MDPSLNNEFVRALVGTGSDREISDSLGLFDRLIGSWEWTGTDYLEGGQELPTRGRWIFERVLNGNAIQDVFIFEDPGDNPLKSSYAEYGTTVRFPEGDGQTWKSVFLGPMNNVIRVFDSRLINDEIVMGGTNEKGQLIHWIFSEITDSTFRWRGEYSMDSGRNWVLYENLKASRSIAD